MTRVFRDPPPTAAADDFIAARARRKRAARTFDEPTPIAPEVRELRDRALDLALMRAREGNEQRYRRNT